MTVTAARARPASPAQQRALQRQLVAQRLPAWRAKPSVFATEVLGMRPWTLPPHVGSASQAQVMDAVPNHKSVAWRSGHKVGKSEAAAALALWWYALRPGGRVILTAPTARQIREVVWRAVKRQWAAAKARGIHLGGGIGETPSTGVVGPGGRQIIGISTDEADRFSGISGDVLYIVDEGSGVPDLLWEAIEGNRAGGARLITLGNPTRTDGAFFRAFHEEAELWATFHTSSAHTPKALGLPIDGDQQFLAGEDYVAGRAKAWGVGSMRYQVRVEGNFPVQGSDAVFSLAHIQESIRRHRLGDDPSPFERATERLVVGVDVARFGDDSTAFVARRGKRVLAITTIAGKDTVQVCGALSVFMSGLMTSFERDGVVSEDDQPLVNVDVAGMGGGVADLMRAGPMGSRIVVQDINGAMAADDDEEFPNLRSQMWFAAADWIADGGELPDDPRLRADLLTPRYKFDVRARQALESKDELKKRLGRSPDIGDAFVNAVYGRVQERFLGVYVEGL